MCLSALLLYSQSFSSSKCLLGWTEDYNTAHLDTVCNPVPMKYEASFKTKLRRKVFGKHTDLNIKLKNEKCSMWRPLSYTAAALQNVLVET